MLTNKRKKELRSDANSLNAIIQIGKDGLSYNVLETIHLALEAHELIKISVLKTAPVSLNELAIEISSQLDCDIVQIIGRVIILYRKASRR